MPPTPDAVIKRLLEARYGWHDVPENILQELGKQTIKMEREFNRRAGFTAKDDRIPEWMTREPLAPHNAVFDVPTRRWIASSRGLSSDGGQVSDARVSGRSTRRSATGGSAKRPHGRAGASWRTLAIRQHMAGK